MPLTNRGRVAAALCVVAAMVTPAAAQAQSPGSPVNTQPPVVSQSQTTLSTTTGTWFGVTRPFAYEWLRCADSSTGSCIVVPGQTSATYPVTALDAGARLRSRVTGSNPIGSRAVLSAPTPPMPAPAPAATGPRAVPRLTPFPVLVVTGRTKGARTRITGLLARGPAGARVAVSCRGACRARPFSRRISRTRRVRLTRGQVLYRAGAIIEVRITGQGRVGKYVRLRIRSGRVPARSDGCLAPAARAPSACS